MKTIFQVFVSSTFEDLRDARKEVSSALLKSDCFPVGMELFPAADLEQFEYIKQVISESDYFVLVSAGKYGTLHPETGISYTEMEYDYALEIGKPVVRLLHKSPFEDLKGAAIESTDAGKSKLRKFREKLSKSRLVNYWDDPKDLGQQTVLALLDLKKRSPKQGWVRGENALTVDILKELETLRTKIKSNAQETKAEQVVSFSDLVNQSEVSVYVQGSDDNSKKKRAGSVKIDNKHIAEAVFLSLISQTDPISIGVAAGDILTSNFAFPERYQKHDHYWLELAEETVEYALHMLESRQLVLGNGSEYDPQWRITSRGRLHATFISSQKNFS